MFTNFKILPLTIVIALIAFVSQTVETYKDGKVLVHEFFISSSIAETTKKEEEPEKEPEDKEKTEEHKEEAKKEETAKESSGEHGKHEESKDSETSETKDAASGETVESKEPEEAKCAFSQTELDLLQSLSKRREELGTREKELELKESLLKATETKIDQKITDLKDLKTQVETMLQKYDEQEEAKIRSLVKIYESMKPKDAAKIFEELDMNVLLEVADRMKEVKAAPVMAEMDPKRAKELTLELAKHRSLKPKRPPEEKTPDALQSISPETKQQPEQN